MKYIIIAFVAVAFTLSIFVFNDEQSKPIVFGETLNSDSGLTADESFVLMDEFSKPTKVKNVEKQTTKKHKKKVAVKKEGGEVYKDPFIRVPLVSLISAPPKFIGEMPDNPVITGISTAPTKFTR